MLAHLKISASSLLNHQSQHQKQEGSESKVKTAEASCNIYFLVISITWFRRQRRGREWFTSVLKEISKKAGMSKVYTNSSMRPTAVTGMLKAGYDSRQVASFTGHKSLEMVQHYSRQLEGMQKEEKKKASALLTPSGRNKKRDAVNNLKKVF